MLPTSPSQVRQNYRPECEAAINSHAALEFHASFHCLAVAVYLWKSLSLSCLIVASFFDFDSRFLISEHLPVSLPHGKVVHQRRTCTFSTFCRAPNNTWATPMIIGSQGALLPFVEVL